MNLTNILNANW